MIGAELPGVFVNVMRGGPGLGNIAPEQSDIKLACRGLGHGNTHAIVLAPATPQEMLDLTMLAFELSFKYRNPVVVLGDGYLGQMTGRVDAAAADGQAGPARRGRCSGDRAHRAQPDLLDLSLRDATSRRTTSTSTRKYADDGARRAAGRPLPVRRRRGPAGRVQHARAHGEGRGRAAARARA